MKDLVFLASDLQSLFEEKNWNFCFIGGLALQHWGEPRLTQDIDVTLLTGWGNEEPYIDFLLKKYPARIPDVKNFALKARVLLLQSEEGVGIDIALAGLPFEEQAVQRSLLIDYLPNIKIRICSAEDLIVFKAFANRDRDWLDIKGITIRQPKLDWSYILNFLTPLAEAKEDPSILDKIKTYQS